MQSMILMVLLISNKPFNFQIENIVQIYNESIVLIIAYHVCIWIGFSMEPTVRFAIGTSGIVWIIALIAVNCLLWLKGIFKTLKLYYLRRRRRKQLAIVMKQRRAAFA